MADDYFNDSNIPEIDIQIKSEMIVSTSKKMKFHALKAGQIYRRIDQREPHPKKDDAHSIIIVLEINPREDFWWQKCGRCVFSNGIVTNIDAPLPILNEELWELVEELEDFNGK